MGKNLPFFLGHTLFLTPSKDTSMAVKPHVLNESGSRPTTTNHSEISGRAANTTGGGVALVHSISHNPNVPHAVATVYDSLRPLHQGMLRSELRVAVGLLREQIRRTRVYVDHFIYPVSSSSDKPIQ